MRNAGKAAGGFANIPAKANRKRSFPFSAFLYRYRNLVELNRPGFVGDSNS